MALSIKTPMFLYDKEHGMTANRYEDLSKVARACGFRNPQFTKEVWTCSEHGDFPVIGIVGDSAPVVVCPRCKEQAEIAEESKNIWLDVTFPGSGLYPTQKDMTLENYGADASKFYSFMRDEDKVFLIVNKAYDIESEMATALVVDFCRLGKQGHYITYQNLKYRVQASWKGKTNTEQLTKDMAKYPLLVIDEIDSSMDAWMETFLNGLFSARAILKRKTVLLGDHNLRMGFGQKVMKKVSADITKEIIR